MPSDFNLWLSSYPRGKRMIILANIREGLFSLRINKIRLFLPMLSIIAGVASSLNLICRRRRKEVYFKRD